MAAPDVYIGAASAQFLRTILARYAAERIFLVADPHAYASSGAERAYQALLDRPSTVRFTYFSANPKFADVRRGIEAFTAREFDAVVAIGGGTALDMAKLICTLSRAAGQAQDVIVGRRAAAARAVPLIAVPTTAGSGSETTHFAVVYLRGRKYSVAHPSLLPDVAIIDPSFTMSCPPYLTAACGMDALSQAIESYWSIHSTPASQRYSVQAIALILEHAALAVQKGGPEHRLALAVAAHAAGKAINITKTTAPHALSYALSARHGIAHGQAVGIFLPAFILYNSAVSEQDVADPRGAAHVRRAMREIHRLLAAQTAQESAQRVIALMQSMGLATTLTGLGIAGPDAAGQLAAGVDYERLTNNPRRVTADAVRRLLADIQ